MGKCQSRERTAGTINYRLEKLPVQGWIKGRQTTQTEPGNEDRVDSFKEQFCVVFKSAISPIIYCKHLCDVHVWWRRDLGH